MSIIRTEQSANPYSSISLARQSSTTQQRTPPEVKAPVIPKIKHREDGASEIPVVKMNKPDGSTHVFYKSDKPAVSNGVAPSLPEKFPTHNDIKPPVLKIYGPDGRERGFFTPQPGDDTDTPVLGVKTTGDVPDLNPGSCTTCSERLYQDKSTDSGVSFQAPGHISPEASLTKVSSHEQEHVDRESRAAEANDQKVISKQVAIHMSRCPECNRLYAAGGETKITKMKIAESHSHAQDTGHSAGTAAPGRFDKAI